MAIKVLGTTVIDDSRNLTNVTSLGFTDATSISTATGVVTAYDKSNVSIDNIGSTVLRTLDNPNAYSTATIDSFGNSVAISGNYCIVGTEQEDDSGGTSSGKAYIFNVTTGQLLHTLDNPNVYGTSASDIFGTSVAISGNYAIVSAYQEDDSGGVNSGKAYIYNVATGTRLHTLDNPNGYNTSANDNFGRSVAISDNYAIVGAHQEDDAGGVNSGKAYIFNVTTGALVHTLNNPNAFGTSAGDNFGNSVAISGNYCIVGAYQEDEAGGDRSGKAYIFNVTTGALVHTLNNPNAFGTSTSDYFGSPVAISGNYAIVGVYDEDDAGGNASGKAYIFNVTTGALVHTLDNPNPVGTSSADIFGVTVAISGNYAIIGARGEDDTSNDSGKAYIFNVITGALVHTLDNPNAYGTSANDLFGFSVAISGNYAIVSAYSEDEGGGSGSGKAYIFNVDDIISISKINQINFIGGGTLDAAHPIFNQAYVGGQLLHTLDNPNAYSTSFNDNFGWAVAISGNYVIVGAYGEHDAGGTISGKAYIFNATTGALLHTLDNPNAYSTSASDQFGASVAISGNYAIVGAYLEDDSGGTSSGKAYIFNVTTGALLHTLDNPNAYGTSADDRFSQSVAISGNYAIVSANQEDDAGGTTSGKAYIFNVTTGTLVHTLDNPNPYSTSANDNFGISVAISGNYVIVGANQEELSTYTSSGTAYIFNVTTGALIRTLNNPNAYSTWAGDTFGISVAIDGNYAIVGANSEDDAGGFSSGKAYIFDVTTGTRLHTLDNPNAYGTSASDNFGNSVAISGNYAIVGVYQEDDSGGTSSGKAYIFNVTTGALVYTLDNPNAFGTSADDRFSQSVAISGNYAIVGARLEDDGGTGLGTQGGTGSSSGKAYIFAVDNMTYLDKAIQMVLE